jgi:hypothetical protein
VALKHRGLVWVAKVSRGGYGRIDNAVPALVGAEVRELEDQGLPVGIEHDVELLLGFGVAQGEGQGMGLL